MNTICLQCGEELQDKRGGAKFCSLECKNQYNYSQRNGQRKPIHPKKYSQTPNLERDKSDKSDNPLEQSLTGVLQNEQPDNTIKIVLPNPDAELAHERINENLYLEGDNDQKSGSSAPIPALTNLLPEQYISKEVQVENPVYTDCKNKLHLAFNYLQKLETEYKQLQAALIYQQARNGDDFLTAGALSGGLAGILSNSETENNIKDTDSKIKLLDKKGKEILSSKKNGTVKRSQRDDKSSAWERFFKTIFLTATGTVLGIAAKKVTQDWREKDKAKKIAEIKKCLTNNLEEKKKVGIYIKAWQAFQSKVQQFSSQTVKILNPDYQKALNGLTEAENSSKTDLPSEKQKSLSENTTTKKEGQIQSITFKSDKIIKATDLAIREFKALNFQGLWQDFFGLPSLNFHILIHGNSGEGKSTYCLWFARYLAKNFGRVLYVSGEEGVNKTFHDKLIACKAEVANLYILDVRTGEEFLKEVGVNEFHFVVFDSLHDMEIDAQKLKMIFERYKNTAFVCIDQNNKKGELLGANEKKHICDVVVNVKNYTAETTKNRFKAKGISFKTADFVNESVNRLKNPDKGNTDRNGNSDKGYDLDSDRRGII